MKACKHRRAKKRRRLWPLLCLLLAALALWTLWGNEAPQLTRIRCASPLLPEAFDGFRIAQVSDLHDAELGRNNQKLIDLVRAAQPDIIVLTGDMVDSNRLDIPRTLTAVRGLCGIAPVYYVNGNHEAALANTEYMRLKQSLEELGVKALEDRSVLLERSGAAIQLVGLNDIGFIPGGISAKKAEAAKALKLLTDEHLFTVCLSHRPELNELYAVSNADLTLCGHAHGGQARLPFIGGLYSPGQGLFPRYTAGSYEIAPGKAMIVSRGLGNSVFPLRFNNRPEVVLIELYRS